MPLVYLMQKLPHFCYPGRSLGRLKLIFCYCLILYYYLMLIFDICSLSGETDQERRKCFFRTFNLSILNSPADINAPLMKLRSTDFQISLPLSLFQSRVHSVCVPHAGFKGGPRGSFQLRVKKQGLYTAPFLTRRGGEIAGPQSLQGSRGAASKTSPPFNFSPCRPGT